MSENFNLEIITPEKPIFKSEATQVTIPSFEGLMSILKDHVSLVTFLRPGFIEALSQKGEEKFFVEEGTVEFSNNNLTILSSTILDIKELSKEKISKMIEDCKNQISKDGTDDKKNYIISHKLDVLSRVNL